MSRRICRGDWRSFLDSGPGTSFEHTMLRGMVISGARMGIAERTERIWGFLPEVTNWSVCDSFSWKIPAEERGEAWMFLMRCLDTGREFHMRFAVVTMMFQFLDEEHIDLVLETAASRRSEGHYYKTGVAWCLSCCYIRFPGRTADLLRGDRLDDSTRRLAIRKITESRRVTDADRAFVRGLRRSS